MTRSWEGGSLEPVGTRDHARGPEGAPVTLVKYGDYECPYCGELHPVLKELQERAVERVRFVFRHFPLDSVHPRARRAALAAEAAGAQGRFWEMHDLLYENQATRPSSGSSLGGSRRTWRTTTTPGASRRIASVESVPASGEPRPSS